MSNSQSARVAVAIVDDDEAVRESTRLLLELWGFEAHSYKSGPDFLRSDPARFQFLLIDYQLPAMTGIDIISRLREQGQRTPAALMTGSTSPDIRRRALELGGFKVFSKPLDEAELIAAIRGATEG